MKKLIYITLSFVALLFLGVDVATAQEGNVEIVTTYTPEIAPATKLLAPTKIADDPKIDPDINYNVKSSLWQIDLEAHNFNPARASYWDHTGYKQFFAKADFGYPLSSDARFRYAMQTPKLGYFGVGVDHAGDFAARHSALGVKRSVLDSYNMQNRVLLNGGVFAGSRMFEASLIYDNDIFNGYAMAIPERRMFHDAALALRFGDDFVDLEHLNFSVEIDGDVWAHRLPDYENTQSEYHTGAKAKMARNFSSNTITVDLDFDMWQGSNHLNYGDMRFGGGVGYARNFGFFSVEAGIGYLYDKVTLRDKASHFVLPRAKVMFDLEKASFVPYVDFNTSLSQNGISSLYGLNPYIDYAAMRDELSAMANTCSYNLALGFTGTLLSSRLSYHAYVGSNFMRDELFWYVTSPGKFGVEVANNTRIFVGVGAKYQPVAGLELSLDYNYHFDSNKSPYKHSEPIMRGALNVKYTLRDWEFYVDGKLIGRREWSILSATTSDDVFFMPTAFDLGAGVSYRVNRMIEVFATGYNFLNNKHIYDYAYYYQPGVGFKVGVKVDF